MTAAHPGGRRLVEGRGITVALGGRPVLRGVDLDVAGGQVVALLGPNGAGKSTVFRALLGFVPLTGGSITLDGIDVGTASRSELRRLRSRVGFVPQRLGLVGQLSAFANVLLGGLGRLGTWGSLPLTARASARHEAMAALDRVGMAPFAGQRTATLSGGQQQRVAVARMLMQRPRTVLADEPAASLDPQAALEIMGLLLKLAREDGLAVIVSLHQLQHLDCFADHIVGLREGRVVCCGGASEFDSQRARLLYGATA
jgi:phosphonate transport system ATP-binding protein